jgi:hypothetical protein
MTYLRVTLLCLIALCFAKPATAQGKDATPAKVTSPNGQIAFLLFDASDAREAGRQAAVGAPTPEGLRYAVEFHGKRLM